MTTPRVTYCSAYKCKHYMGAYGPPDDPVFVCEAFPKGIPEEILSGSNRHLTSYGGDEGITFEPYAEPAVEMVSKDVIGEALEALLKGGPNSGWYAPPKGTHTGEKHRAAGSGKSGASWGKKATAKPAKTGDVARGDRVHVVNASYGDVGGKWGKTTEEFEGIYLGKVTSVSGMEYHKVMDADGTIHRVSDSSMYWDDSKIEHSSGGIISTQEHGKYELIDQTVVKLDGEISGYAHQTVAEGIYSTPEWARANLDYIVLHEGGSYKFIASNGKEYSAGGNYDASENTVNVFNAKYPRDHVELMQHEIGHNVYNDAKSQLMMTAMDMLKETPESPSPYKHLFSKGYSFKDDPALRPEIDKALRKVGGAHVAAYYAFETAWKDGQDGVTDYSKAWHGKPTETWAEMSQLYWTGNNRPSPRGSTNVRSAAKDNGAVELGEAFLSYVRARDAQARRAK